MKKTRKKNLTFTLPLSEDELTSFVKNNNSPFDDGKVKAIL